MPSIAGLELSLSSRRRRWSSQQSGGNAISKYFEHDVVFFSRLPAILSRSLGPVEAVGHEFANNGIMRWPCIISMLLLMWVLPMVDISQREEAEG
jgi:hypothetical protein